MRDQDGRGETGTRAGTEPLTRGESVARWPLLDGTWRSASVATMRGGEMRWCWMAHPAGQLGDGTRLFISVTQPASLPPSPAAHGGGGHLPTAGGSGGAARCERGYPPLPPRQSQRRVGVAEVLGGAGSGAAARPGLARQSARAGNRRGGTLHRRAGMPPRHCGSRRYPAGRAPRWRHNPSTPVYPARQLPHRGVWVGEDMPQWPLAVGRIPALWIRAQGAPPSTTTLWRAAARGSALGGARLPGAHRASASARRSGGAETEPPRGVEISIAAGAQGGVDRPPPPLGTVAPGGRAPGRSVAFEKKRPAEKTGAGAEVFSGVPPGGPSRQTTRGVCVRRRPHRCTGHAVWQVRDTPFPPPPKSLQCFASGGRWHACAWGETPVWHAAVEQSTSLARLGCVRVKPSPHTRVVEGRQGSGKAAHLTGPPPP